jgi:hypothetical protein
MQEPKRQIFRTEAWNRYLARQEATVFPRLLTPHSLAVLWLLLALVIAGGSAILSMEAPVYSAASAIALTGAENNGSGAHFVALAPGTEPRAFQPGSGALVELAENRPPLTASIIEVEKAQIGLAEASMRFGLRADALSTIRFPASVIFVRLSADGGDLLRSVDRNVIYQAQVESGKQRAISYVISAGTNE